MKDKGFYLTWRSLLHLSIVGLLLFTVNRISSAAHAGSFAEPQQDVIRLDTRINQLEQRLYIIENNLRNLDQQARVGGARAVSPEDLTRLMAEVSALERRLADDECGLARLDERTLSPEVRRKAGGASNECRQNINAPLRLP